MLDRLFLFSALSDHEREKIAKSLTVTEIVVQPGERVYPRDEFAHSLGYIESGRVTVYRERPGADPIPLNGIGEGGVFGVIDVFGTPAPYPTVIRANTESRILYISRDELIGLLNRHPELYEKLLGFLCDKVRFLNEKVALLGAQDATARLAAYLRSQAEVYGSDTIPFVVTEVAKELNLGRASLYRALDELTASGAVSLSKKILTVKNVDLLKEGTSL